MCPAVLVFALMAGQQAGRNAYMSFAESSWSAVITESSAVILMGQVRELQGLRPSGSNQQTGLLAVRVLRELTPNRGFAHSDLAVSFAQLSNPRSRLREGNSGWNGVDVRPGTMLLMGIAGGKENSNPSAPLSLEAVSQLSSPEDSLIVAVTQALRIEATEAPQQRLLLLTQALSSGLPVLETYAHYALGRKQRVPRSDAAALEIGVLLDRAKSDDQRLASESNLDLELWVGGDADDPVNRKILGALLQILANREPGLQKSTTLALYRILSSDAPSEHTAGQLYRSHLLRDTQPEGMKAVRAALGDAENDPDLSAQASDLISILSENNH